MLRGLAVRPTSRGWQALVAGVAVLVVARLIGTTQFHQLAYLLLLLVVAALGLGVAVLRGIAFERRLPEEVRRITAGRPAGVGLVISNRSRLLWTPRLEVEDVLSRPESAALPPVAPGGQRRVRVAVAFPRRGVYRLGPATVRGADPFGLLVFSRVFREEDAVVVYPEVHRLRGFPVRGGEARTGSRGSRGGHGEEFAGLREYQRGDDRRHIHWKSLAKTGELFVKEFALQAPRSYTVALDLRRGGFRSPEAAVEDAVSAAASVLALLREEGLGFRLLCTDRAGSEVGPGQDERSYWQTMRVLAEVRADGGAELGELLLAGEPSSFGEGVILVCRHEEEGLRTAVRRLRDAGLDVVAVLVAEHTYRGGASRGREARFARFASGLGAAGARVLTVRHPEGVAGLEARGVV
ncbi:hypothetical protein RxyAA322_19300 [Rubrobacter xylanophilus]|uniref:DUF58 domain-containing protein n=1 Tax=Rubrobacter xylanophilus TaxID=49319 RepID=A0A510HJ98_9ACTN|nr:DUF58 domain-containing protein [Rubrobacter xylanophilus]BBL80076.1 hypothetical protein RxyAA322_19300 [Rubrobacter xylanophilus]